MATLPYPDRARSRTILGIIALWALCVAGAAQAGLLLLMPPVMVALTVAGGVAVPTLAYFMLPSVRLWMEHIGLRRLTLFHSWRIVAAFLFFSYGAAGLLPARFVSNAGWGDLVAGVLAIVVVALPMARWRYLGMHIFGLADFVLAVGTGLYFTLTAPEQMVQIRLLPLALIPLFGVSLSGATHLIAFDLIRRRAGGAV